ncbi:MAG: hypothetical protein U0599_13320 [Vicinamibacteria bacterium]
MSPRTVALARTLLFLGAALGRPAATEAQPPALQVPPLPLVEPTRLELFMARQGTLLVTGSSRAGAVRAAAGALVTVASREVRDMATGERATGLSVEVRTSEGRDPDRVSYVDLEEIPPLLAALDAMATVQRTETALDRFEARFLTKGGLLFAVFDRGDGMKAAVASGYAGLSWTELEFGEFQRLRLVLQRAHETLGALKER